MAELSSAPEPSVDPSYLLRAVRVFTAVVAEPQEKNLASDTAEVAAEGAGRRPAAPCSNQRSIRVAQYNGAWRRPGRPPPAVCIWPPPPARQTASRSPALSCAVLCPRLSCFRCWRHSGVGAGGLPRVGCGRAA